MKATSFTHSITSHLVISLLFLCLSLSLSSPAWGTEETVTWTINGVTTPAKAGTDVNTALRTSAVSPSTETGVWTAIASTSYAASSTGAQLGSGSYPFNGTITLSGSAIPSTATITGITLTATSTSTSSKPYSMTAEVASKTFGSPQSLYDESPNCTWSGSVVGNTIVITASCEDKKNIKITAISVTYEEIPCTSDIEAIGAASRTGVCTASSVEVSCASITPGTSCAVEAGDYGFIWWEADEGEDRELNDVDDISVFKVANSEDYVSGAFTNTLTGLTSGATYKFRAFATNGKPSTIYSDAVSFTFNPLTVAWKMDGVDVTAGLQTTIINAGDKVLQLPSTPADDALSVCSNKFVGWSASTIAMTTNTKPADIFTDIAGSPDISTATTFHAVFAHYQTIPNTVLWSEDFSSYSANDVPSGTSNKTTTGRVVYNGGSVQYTCSNGTKNDTKIYAASLAGGVSPELMVGGKGKGADPANGQFDIRNIPSGGASELILTIKRNTTLGVTITGAGYSINDNGHVDNIYSYTITRSSDADATFRLTFTATTTSNVRLDDISIIGEVESYTDYVTSSSSCKVIPAEEAKSTWSAIWGVSAPNINDVVRVNKSISIDVPDATAKEIILGEDVTLTIDAGAALVLANSISKADGSAPSATDLSLDSDEDYGNASLIYDLSAGEIEATVGMYSNLSTNNWQYVAVPYQGVTASESSLYSAGNLYGWVVGSGWVEVGSSDELEPFVGYAVTNSKPVTFSLAGPLVNTESINIAVGAYKNRVVGNSWTAPIQISQMTSDDFTGGLAGNQTVYLFNTGNDDGSGTVSDENNYDPGTYISIPINATASVGVSKISSMQGFYVKNRHATNDGTLKLNYAKHVRPTGTNTPVNGLMHAPKRVQDENYPTEAKIKVSGSRYTDQLILLERNDFTNAYDGGWDGDKMGDNAEAPRIYTLREDGTKDAVSAVPDLAGKELVFRAGTTDSQYTMSFSYEEDAEDLYLYDNETNTYTQVLTDNTYTFTTTDKAEHPRFTLLRANAPQIATGVENVQSDGVQCTKAHKELRDGQLLIHRGGHTYNAAGILVK